MLRTVLFDLDGTLADSIPLILASFRHAARCHLETVPDDGFWLAHIGGTLRQQFLAAGAPETRIPDLEAAYRDYYVARHDDAVRPFEGVHGVLDRLGLAGCRLGLVTSKSRVGATRTLRRCGLTGRFAVEVTADDTDRHKPDPEPLLAALRALGVDARGAVYVGDAPQDIEAGRRAGLATAAALWGAVRPEVLLAAKPDHRLDHPEALLDLVSS